jgi:hypothetical protein
MVRAAVENILSPNFIDGIFRSTACVQTERQLLFSSIVEVMCLVVCKPGLFTRKLVIRENPRVISSV